MLQEEWLRATEQLIDARLPWASMLELVPELTALTKQYPLRERFWAQLMLALNNSARQADALAAYHELTVLLRDELGVDPGEELRRVYLAVLAGNERSGGSPAVAGAPSAPDSTSGTSSAGRTRSMRSWTA